ncbi:MAG: 23S rRNA (uracil(1939)-C(5))-methyltransferase RlmD [Bacteroidetes bacterium]|nr:23S rRNA (uracil(1939)-C(5))-methyltransferase RlmD [Bacteroidota bacterium]MBV6461573.1 23S rRNA (uracil-C(5))-methyltransferase RlmCD [Flavobacteriales bacterium]WKZ74054.1 MAG: 23S rRNA (uracil(1939)-C(5))-methyltransferase RlmD [Vicingaceae bacterium]MCL4817187.1 23S rRNA (uracil(1939)-C(5))-methyltransferase RlmD [Flavobacteriales bacterium]NOG95858.1 23S rRNA (uracil(1939)-C(5))-methyltransferase RlmD [Bacteroidota bacterium]
MANVVIENLEICDIGSQGKAIGKKNEKVYFVESLVPGDIADVQVYKKKKNYAEAFPVNIRTYSPLRTVPKCKHFGECGGCKWQHMNYNEQLRFKQQQVTETLTRLAKVPLPEILPIVGSDNEYFYRNKLEFTFSNKRWITKKEAEDGHPINEPNALGFHIPGRFDKILNIDECFLQADFSNQIRNFIREYALKNKLSFYDVRNHTGFLRNLIIRNTTQNEWMLVLVVAQANEKEITRLMNEIHIHFAEINSLLYIVNTKRNDTIYDQEVITFKGPPYITEKIGTLRYRISPKSFFQTNTFQAKKLYDIVLQFAELKGNENVYDLYTGTGTIANYIAHAASKVIGIEYIEDAITDATINAQLNQIENASFFAGDLKDVFLPDFIKNNGKPDVIITDPPRAGMHPDVVQQLITCGAEKIVYVSCNPASQARDIAMLDNTYKVTNVQPVDMFPHTHHVENVILLEKK